MCSITSAVAAHRSMGGPDGLVSPAGCAQFEAELRAAGLLAGRCVQGQPSRYTSPIGHAQRVLRTTHSLQQPEELWTHVAVSNGWRGGVNTGGSVQIGCKRRPAGSKGAAAAWAARLRRAPWGEGLDEDCCAGDHAQQQSQGVAGLMDYEQTRPAPSQRVPTA
jgi:hypothetical protein